MSNHFKISCAAILIGTVALLFVYHYLSQHVEQLIPGLRPRAATVLPLKDKELVSYNEKTHTLTVQTPNKTVTEYAKNPIVELRKNGDVVIGRHLAGFENEWFMGVGLVLSGPRFFVGDNLLHLSRFDVQASVGVPFEKQTGFIRLYAGLGWNFYSNTSLNLSVNPLAAAQAIPDVALFLSTRF
jgi:hypothetical protein